MTSTYVSKRVKTAAFAGTSACTSLLSRCRTWRSPGTSPWAPPRTSPHRFLRLSALLLLFLLLLRWLRLRRRGSPSLRLRWRLLLGWRLSCPRRRGFRLLPESGDDCEACSQRRSPTRECCDFDCECEHCDIRQKLAWSSSRIVNTDRWGFCWCCSGRFSRRGPWRSLWAATLRPSRLDSNERTIGLFVVSNFDMHTVPSLVDCYTLLRRA